MKWLPLFCTDGTVSCMASYFVCNTILSSIIARAGGINVRDINYLLTTWDQLFFKA
ncbi:hypothetical protein ES332_A05G462200v1 [Gossypium tomentosum]|uniref:Uncharacterized protein n=1 Tax=Gossypium tomentosum TaxID=34277 RepID=A0A5D2QT56_GOSTO|nr:hypothetical protein ES332_A05G462200v1 [Gossypium tomentosum]